MTLIFNSDRYKKLLEKEKRLRQQNKSLLFDDEGLEFLSYNSQIQKQISYQRKDDYYSFLDQYISELITPQVFQFKFLEMEKQDANEARIILSDFQQLETFLVELLAIEFSFLLEKVYDVSMLAQEFGPEEGISDEDFYQSVKKIYLEMTDFFDK